MIRYTYNGCTIGITDGAFDDETVHDIIAQLQAIRAGVTAVLELLSDEQKVSLADNENYILLSSLIAEETKET